MDQEIQVWLNESYLASCLQGGNPEAPRITITSFDAQPGVPPGNNYGSVILRVKVEYEEGNSDDKKNVSLIVKVPINNELTETINFLFGKAEYNFYYTYLPVLKGVTREHSIPRTYFTAVDSVVVLEDLKESQFEMADRQKQLDYEHSKLYFINSAKFHATGIVIAKQNPELIKLFPNVFEKIKNGEDMSKLERIMHDIFVGFKCLVKSLEPLALDEYKTYIGAIKKFIELNDNAGKELKKKKLEAAMKTNETMFKSFIHGDCWTTNMMFKHDMSGNPIDIRLVDFQGFRYDAVVSDLINFTWMSCSNEVLENHLDELYKIYCDTLNSKLVEFGCPERLTYERLKEEMYENGVDVLNTVAMFLPLTQHEELMDTTKLFSMEIKEEDIMKYYQGVNFFNKFPRVFKFVAKRGVFDRLEKFFEQWEQFQDQLLENK